MIRFMSDTRYAGLEKEMQHIPGFRPRRSGMVNEDFPIQTQQNTEQGMKMQ